MRQSNEMGKMVIKLANMHGFDLSAVYAHMRLRIEGYEDLVIEKHGPNIVAVMHLDDLDAVDPMFRFVVFPVEGKKIDWEDWKLQKWFPITSTMRISRGRTRVLVYKGDKPGAWYVDQRLQPDAASFVLDWARNIRDQHWITESEVMRQFAVTSERGWAWTGNLGNTKESPDALIEIEPADANRTSLCRIIDTDILERIYSVFQDDQRGFVMYGDEEARFREGCFINSIATRFFRFDEGEPEGMDIAGTVVLLPTTFLKGD